MEDPHGAVRARLRHPREAECLSRNGAPAQPDEGPLHGGPGKLPVRRGGSRLGDGGIDQGRTTAVKTAPPARAGPARVHPQGRLASSDLSCRPVCVSFSLDRCA